MEVMVGVGRKANFGSTQEEEQSPRIPIQLLSEQSKRPFIFEYFLVGCTELVEVFF